MTQDQKQKISTAVLSAIFLLLVFLLMAVSKVPKNDVSEVIAKIDVDMLAKFEPKKIEFKKPEPEKEEPEEIEKEPEPEETTEEVPEEVDVQPDQTVERVELNLDVFKQLNAGEVQAPTKTIEAPGRATPELPSVDINKRKATVKVAGPTLVDDQSTLTSFSRKNNAANLDIEAGTVKDAAPGQTSYGTDGGADDQGRQTLGTSTGPQITMVSKAALRRGKVELINLNALIKWMKENPADFDRVIKNFVEYKTGALTSRATFKIKGQSFELYIMCFEATSEVRIALIEGNQVIRLIDQGFTGENEQFVIGSVLRAGKKILGFNTSQKPIGDEQSSNFNQIVVSWWESVKDEVL